MARNLCTFCANNFVFGVQGIKTRLLILISLLSDCFDANKNNIARHFKLKRCDLPSIIGK